METVCLDEELKREVLLDMNDYLSSKTAEWYAKRGIPHRRGYLFDGPLGTGKTSLIFALAGRFGLDIYMLSLLNPEISESGLVVLFTRLPPRCIVLIEDIDAAGLVQGRESDIKTQQGPSVVDLVGALKKVEEKNISLSCLLNLIDGTLVPPIKLRYTNSNEVSHLLKVVFLR